MSKKYHRFERPLKEMPAEEISWLSKKMKAIIMRTIILNEKEFLSVNYERSMRGFWYSTVKPVLDKLGLLTEKDAEEKEVGNWNEELSRYMSELVRMGELTYKDLNIVDTSRQRENPSEKYMTTDVKSFGYKVQVDTYANIIICVEKDTAYNIIKDLSSFLGCSCISSKGQNSLAAMEDLLRGIKESTSNNEPIYILTLTDYDPSGYIIANNFKKQTEDLQKALKMENEVYSKRIGITPNQLTLEEVENNKYTPKPKDRDEWMEITGGINGEPKGLELDALTPDRIRELFVDNIKEYIDTSTYIEFVKQSYLKKLVLDAISNKVNEITEEVNNIFLKDVELADFDIWELAQRGDTNIPIEEICTSQQTQEIENKVLNWFK